MADSISIDTSEVRELAFDLSRAPAEAAIATRAAMQKGALNIKNDLKQQAQASGIAEAKELARFISYDTKVTRQGITAEIGPVEGHAGSFAFLYYGNSKNGPVLPDPGDALEREAPNLEKYLGEVLERFGP